MKIKLILSLLLIITLGVTGVPTVNAAVKKGDTFAYDSMNFKITTTSTSDRVGEVTVTGYSNKKTTQELNIPSRVEYNKMKYKVTSISYGAFKNSKFKKATIPNTIKKIDGQAFMKCTNLKSVTLSKGITSIPLSAFNGCTKLTDITIPSMVSKIEPHAFSGCASLKKITINKNILTVGQDAFKGCNNLTVTIPKYTTYEKDLIDNDIKYTYSNESVFSVEQIDANTPGNGIVYYKITNSTPLTYSYFSVECLLLDSSQDQIGGENSSLKILFKPGDSTVFGVQTKDKIYSEVKLIVNGSPINKAHKDMSNYINVSLVDDKTINYDQFLEITSASSKKIDMVNIEVVFYNDNKLVYISNFSFDNVYKGVSTQPFYFPSDLNYDSYTTNITAITIK